MESSFAFSQKKEFTQLISASAVHHSRSCSSYSRESTCKCGMLSQKNCNMDSKHFRWLIAFIVQVTTQLWEPRTKIKRLLWAIIERNLGNSLKIEQKQHIWEAMSTCFMRRSPINNIVVSRVLLSQKNILLLILTKHRDKNVVLFFRMGDGNVDAGIGPISESMSCNLINS